MSDCIASCKGMKLLVFGLVIVLTRMFTNLDIWIVLGGLIILKALMIILMPVCHCTKNKEKE